MSTGYVAFLAGMMGSSSQGYRSRGAIQPPDRHYLRRRAGALYVADTGNHTVRRIDIASRAVTTVIGSPSGGGVVLGALPAGLGSPYGLLFLPSFGLFITDSCENALRLLQ